MPKLMNASTTVVGNTISNFGFSGKRIDELTASEYTLADIEIDLSSSVQPFENELTDALVKIIESCRKHPLADKMLVRVATFNGPLNEIHGFVNLSDIKADDYNLKAGGNTPLYDAAHSGIEALGTYGKTLADMDYGVNGVMFVVTDGAEYGSRASSIPKIVAALNQVRKEEKLESIKTILIGVGDQAQVKAELEQFQKDAQFDQFIWAGTANASSLAKLADFISKSISASSTALGSGGASKNLTF